MVLLPFDAEFAHQSEGLLFFLFDGLLQIQDFILEFPDLDFGLVLLLLQIRLLLLPLLLYLRGNIFTYFSFFN